MAVRKDNIQIVVAIEAQAGVRAYQKLLDESRNVNAEMRKLKRLGKENSDEFRALEKRAAELNGELRNLGGAGANMGQLIERSKRLNRELRSLVPGTQRFIDATKELKDVNGRLKDIRDQTRAVSAGLQEVQVAGLTLPPVFGKIALAMKAMVKAFFAIQLVQFFFDLVNSVNETIPAFQKLRGEIEQTTQASAQNIDTYTAKVAALDQTFGKETGEILTAANALTKQLTGDFSKSLELIEKGFLAGADRSGDFLDQVKEYPAFFKEAGLSGEQFISVLSQGVAEGVFSDKGVDVLKEFTLRIRELTPATQKALEGIGITSEEIRKKIDEEGIGAAFLLVQERLRQVGDTAPETGAALADIFGGPGEDAGLQFIETLELTDESLNGLIDTENDYTKALMANMEANQGLAEAQTRLAKNGAAFSTRMSTIWTNLRRVVLDVTADIFEFFEELPATGQGVQAAFRAILDNIQRFFDRTALGLQVTLKKIEKLNPFGKTSEQLDAEIADLRGKQSELADTATGIMEAYRTAYLEGMKKIEKDRKVTEALLAPPTPEDLEETARKTAEEINKAVQKAIDETPPEKKPRAKIAPLQALSPTQAPGQVQSTGEAAINTDAETNLVENALLRGVISVQQAEDQKFQIMQEAYNRRLEFLREKFGEESAEFIALENKKLDAQKTYEEQRAQLTRQTEEARQALLEGGVSALGEFVGETISFLKEEEGARKKNSVALKAFSIGKVIIDTQEAVMAIIKNAESNPANILFPGAANIIAGIKIAALLAKSGAAVSKISKTGFYSGGYTGDTPLFRDNQGRQVVGAVHKNEWVGPEWMTRHPLYGPMIGWLETMRQNGYQDGGFAGANNIAPTAQPGAAGAAAQPSSQVENLIREIAASNRELATEIKRKKFTIQSGQIVDALDEESRLDNKAAF